MTEYINYGNYSMFQGSFCCKCYKININDVVIEDKQLKHL
ncbi:hypothetical protein SAMN04489722_101204 [Algibacter lectus]|nr:hypothetical protein SAMN04489722_101204 [Algibacter lectus]